jgi:hypothetical protein
MTPAHTRAHMVNPDAPAPGGETMTPETQDAEKIRFVAQTCVDAGADENGSTPEWFRAGFLADTVAPMLRAYADLLSSTPTRAATDAPQPLMMTDNGFPRRNRTDLWTEAEAAIQHAVDVCERTIPADPLETDAIILLGDARNKIGELVDREIAAGRMLMPSRPAGGPNVMCPQCGCDVIEGLREDVRSGVADKDEVGLLAALESLSSSPSSTTATPAAWAITNDGAVVGVRFVQSEAEYAAAGWNNASVEPLYRALPSSRALSEARTTEYEWRFKRPDGSWLRYGEHYDSIEKAHAAKAKAAYLEGYVLVEIITVVTASFVLDRLTGAPK